MLVLCVIIPFTTHDLSTDKLQLIVRLEILYHYNYSTMCNLIKIMYYSVKKKPDGSILSPYPTLAKALN